jgi:hypothetical protein
VRRVLALALAVAAASAAAAPKIESLAVTPNPARFSGAKPPEVEIAVSVSRTRFDSGSCDARLDFGDGEGRALDFGMAGTRTVRHLYKKGGGYSVVARGAGASPCEGTREVALTVVGPAEKKPAEKKKAQPKKSPKKPAKKEEAK